MDLDLTPADRTRDQLDQLFQQTQRGPFSGARPEEILGELADIPLTQSGVTEDQRFPLYLQGYVIGSMHNDRFIATPPDGDAVALSDITNKLPGWSTVDESTNGAEIIWNAGSNGAASLGFTMTDGVAGDRVYIEQLVYVPGGNVHILAPSFKCSTETAEDVVPFIEYTYVYPDGTLGTPVEKTYTGVAAASGGAIHRVWVATQTTDYAFLRLRFGFKVGTGYTATDEALGDVDWAWVQQPEYYDVTLRFGRGTSGANWSPGVSTAYNIQLVDQAQTYGAAKWVAPAPGLFLAISVRADAAITAGQFAWYPRVNATNATDPVANFHFSNGWTEYALDSRDPTGAVDFDFFRGDRIDIEAASNAFLATPGANWAGTLHLRMVFDEAGDGTNPNDGWGQSGG